MLDKKLDLSTKDNTLTGHQEVATSSNKHVVLGTQLHPPYPSHYQTLMVGMGCFWGAERVFWQQQGVFTTAVGYAGGFSPNPSYEEVCTGLTGHTEVVYIVFDSEQIGLQALLKLFWERHDPTQVMRQGNDIGTQYRSAIYWQKPEHEQTIMQSKAHFQTALDAHDKGEIATELKYLRDFFFAEDYHQQYLAKNPNGYCGLAGTGVCLSQ